MIFNNRTKIIIILSRPIERSLSHYKFYKQIGLYSKNTNLKEAIKLFPNIISDSLYKEHIIDFCKYFNEKQICIIDYNFIKTNPEIALKKVYEFLNVDCSFSPKSLHKIIGKTILPKYQFVEIETKLYKFLISM